MRDYVSRDLAGAAHLARDVAYADRPHPSEYMDDGERATECWACGYPLESGHRDSDCPRCGERL